MQPAVQTRFYLTLRRTSNSQELAKIDPDTELQKIVGPSINQVISVSAQRNFPAGSIYVSCARPMLATPKPASRFRKRRASSGHGRLRD